MVRDALTGNDILENIILSVGVFIILSVLIRSLYKLITQIEELERDIKTYRRLNNDEYRLNNKIEDGGYK